MGNVLYVTRSNNNVSDQELEQTLAFYGPVQCAHYPKFTRVTYQYTGDAERARNMLNGCVLGDTKLEVTLVTPYQQHGRISDRRLAVTNFNKDVSEGILFGLFNQYGPIKYLTKKHKYAIVEYQHTDDALVALQELNGYVISVSSPYASRSHTIRLIVEPEVNKAGL